MKRLNRWIILLTCILGIQGLNTSAFAENWISKNEAVMFIAGMHTMVQTKRFVVAPPVAASAQGPATEGVPGYTIQLLAQLDQHKKWAEALPDNDSSKGQSLEIINAQIAAVAHLDNKLRTREGTSSLLGKTFAETLSAAAVTTEESLIYSMSIVDLLIAERDYDRAEYLLQTPLPVIRSKLHTSEPDSYDHQVEDILYLSGKSLKDLKDYIEKTKNPNSIFEFQSKNGFEISRTFASPQHDDLYVGLKRMLSQLNAARNLATALATTLKEKRQSLAQQESAPAGFSNADVINSLREEVRALERKIGIHKLVKRSVLALLCDYLGTYVSELQLYNETDHTVISLKKIQMDTGMGSFADITTTDQYTATVAYRTTLLDRSKVLAPMVAFYGIAKNADSVTLGIFETSYRAAITDQFGVFNHLVPMAQVLAKTKEYQEKYPGTRP